MASYLLSCGCGNKLVVEPRQAGESVRCACGTDLEVPTMRTLSQLPRADAASDAAHPAWTPREGLIFLGLVVAVSSLVLTGYFFVNRPVLEQRVPAQLEDIQKMVNTWSLSESWGQWLIMQSGLWESDNTPASVAFNQAMQIRQRRMLGAAAVAVCGLLVAGGALMMRSSKQKLI